MFYNRVYGENIMIYLSKVNKKLIILTAKYKYFILKLNILKKNDLTVQNVL